MRESNNEKLMELASRRYPNDAPSIALCFFLSDRRAAGMGALKCSSKPGAQVSNTKHRDHFRRETMVVWHMAINRPPHRRLMDQDFDYSTTPIDKHAESETRTFELVQEFKASISVRVPMYSLLEQEDRNRAAQLLRQRRRELKKGCHD